MSNDAMSADNEIFISVDIEASGPIPGEFSMLSIGACDVYEPAAAFLCLIKPISDNFVPEALAVSGFSLEHAGAYGLSPEDAMAQFAHWVKGISSDRTPVLIGLNAPFDWSFINYYFIRYLGSNPFGFSALDIKAYFMGATKCSWGQTRSSRIKSATGAVGSGNHDALQDAQFQAELFRLLRAG
jgi:DNA polymerase III epsilon subunit-like protein